MVLRLKIRGDEIGWEFDHDAGFIPSRSREFHDWAARYDYALTRNDDRQLAAIGKDIYTWLNREDLADRWATSTDRTLEIQVDRHRHDATLSAALLEVPWELLAPSGACLAADAEILFTVQRRVGAPDTAVPAQFTDLALMFMAAAPRGQNALDFEAEEAAILGATRTRTGAPAAHVVVEESGNVVFLAERLAHDGPFEALHISCHGNADKDRGPTLALETETGEAQAVTPGDLITALGDDKPRLIFLSACRTAAQPDAFVDSYIRRLIHAGAPNVLGWDGSVYDSDATLSPA